MMKMVDAMRKKRAGYLTWSRGATIYIGWTKSASLEKVTFEKRLKGRLPWLSSG